MFQIAGTHQVERVGVSPVDDISDKPLDLGSRFGLPRGKLAVEVFGDCSHNSKIDDVLALVKLNDSTINSDKQLPISKTANRYLPCLLVQASQYLLGHFGPDCDLRRYGLKLAARGGKAAKKKAVIAVARKLAVLMLTLWQKQSDYQPLRHPQAAAA